MLREAENAGHTLDLESKSSASDMTSPMSPQVSSPSVTQKLIACLPQQILLCVVILSVITLQIESCPTAENAKLAFEGMRPAACILKESISRWFLAYFATHPAGSTKQCIQRQLCSHESIFSLNLSCLQVSTGSRDHQAIFQAVRSCPLSAHLQYHLQCCITVSSRSPACLHDLQ